MNCCNNHCRQGRDCPYKKDFADKIAIATLAIAAVILIAFIRLTIRVGGWA